jgi:RNase P protein component
LSYVELLVTFGEGEVRRTKKVYSLVIDYKSLCNCIIERPALAELGAVSSSTHLKMKYHSNNNIATTLHADIEDAHGCFLKANKSQSSVYIPKTPFKGKVIREKIKRLMRATLKLILLILTQGSTRWS